MDGSEYNHRPRKKIRLEATLESRNISISSFQHDGHSQGREHSVYTQAPPSLNFDQARDINPFVSTCETETQHRLTAGYQSARCAELTYQGTETSRSITSCSPSASCTPAETLLEYGNELPTKIYSDQVCFGMVDPHSAAQYSRNVLTML